MDRHQSLQHLISKKRTYEDLSRFLGARAAPNSAPNYTLLMGAGCSVSSRIRSAGELINVWRKEVFQRLYPGEEYTVEGAKSRFTREQSSWYNQSKEYSSLFEKNYDLPRQRRMFVEREVAQKQPNLGYAYLIKLMEAGYINTVFTTNFDDLLNESFFQFSGTRPIICAHDSAISSITVTSPRPKVIKLHGDYLFDDIKATVRETESLEENIKNKFIEFGRDFGLIVAGYSGADRSVMDVLQYLLRSDAYFKNGIYWCIRHGEAPSEDLLKLLWKDRVYFVEVDGFDELMAALHNDLVGHSLPIDTSIVTDKPREIISNFCENPFLNDSPSEFIRRDLEKLKKRDDREHLLSAFRGFKKDDAVENTRSDELTDKGLATVLEIRQLLAAGDFSVARNRILSELQKEPSDSLRDELAELRIVVEELDGTPASALQAADELIRSDEYEVANYLRKSAICASHAQRMDVLKSAEQISPWSARVKARKATYLIEAFDAVIGFDQDELFEQILTEIDESLRYDPSAANSVWGVAFEFLARQKFKKEAAEKKLSDLCAHVSRLGEGRTTALYARFSLLRLQGGKGNEARVDELLRDIAHNKARAPKSDRAGYEWLELDVLERFERDDDFSNRISAIQVDPSLMNRPEFLRRKSAFLLKKVGDFEGAVNALSKAIDVEPKPRSIIRLVEIYETLQRADAISELMERHGKKLKHAEKMLVRRSLEAARGDHIAALATLRSIFNDATPGVADKVEEVHDLIKINQFDEASSLAKKVLDSIAWSKTTGGELIINFELAKLRIGKSIDRGRLGELAKAAEGNQVRGCAFYLLGDLEKAKASFKEEIRKDKFNREVFRAWAIFSDDRGRAFLDSLNKA